MSDTLFDLILAVALFGGLLARPPASQVLCVLFGQERARREAASRHPSRRQERQ